jgi:hypothetical protein
MKSQLTLTITSLLAILLTSFHLADDVVRGLEPGKLSTFNGVLILVVWLYAALTLGDRKWNYIILLLASIGGAGVCLLHMSGVGLVGGRIANSTGKFFWVWTLLALGVTSTISIVLAATGLWRLSVGSRQST